MPLYAYNDSEVYTHLSHIYIIIYIYIQFLYFTYTEWTTNGCVTDLAEVNESVVTCYCNHLTNFAILVVSWFLCVCAQIAH